MIVKSIVDAHLLELTMKQAILHSGGNVWQAIVQYLFACAQVLRNFSVRNIMLPRLGIRRMLCKGAALPPTAISMLIKVVAMKLNLFESYLGRMVVSGWVMRTATTAVTALFNGA